MAAYADVVSATSKSSAASTMEGGLMAKAGATRAIGAGARDRVVTIQRLTQAAGTSGFPVDDWTTLSTLTLMAAKTPLGGRERFGGGNQLSAPYDTRWEIAYLPDMDPDLLDVPRERRIVYEGRTYDIVDASQIGRREGVELLTLARQG